MTRPLLILNPLSDGGRTAALGPRISEWLKELDCPAELVEGRSAADATRLAQDGANRGYDPIVAIGGDGTVHAVASGLLNAGKGVALGVIPVGSGNDYAFRALKLPHNPQEALRIAVGGKREVADAARLNMEWMINSFGVGIDANVAWDVRDMNESGRSPFRGSQLYTFSALKQVFLHYRDLPHMEILIDGVRLPTRRMLLTAVMIGPSAGGGYKLTPEADMADGRLDVLLARPMPRPKVLVALQLLRSGRHTALREVSIRPATRVHIRTTKRTRAHVDGELIMGAAFDIHIVPGALNVMVP